MSRTPSPTGEPRLASVASCAVLVASFGLSASTWIALARLAGFTDTVTVLGIDLAMAWLLPVAVDGYIVVALVLWMAPVPPRVAGVARRNTYLAAGVGIVAQSAYHLLYTLSTTSESWRVVLAALVGALPPAVAAVAVHMRVLIRRESHTTAVASVPPIPALTVPAQPSTIDAQPAVPTTTDGPAASNAQLSLVDTDPVEPARQPVRPGVPTPAEVATRITNSRTTSALEPESVPVAAARKPRPRPSRPATPAASSAPSTTDFSVTAPDVAPDLLNRADEIARQYHTEHATPITAGQLAVRLKVTSEKAAHALAVLDLDPTSSIAPTATVNGRPVKATR
jgi:hypothetical protein